LKKPSAFSFRFSAFSFQLSAASPALNQVDDYGRSAAASPALNQVDDYGRSASIRSPLISPISLTAF
jgi:hypothetical protein